MRPVSFAVLVGLVLLAASPTRSDDAAPFAVSDKIAGTSFIAIEAAVPALPKHRRDLAVADYAITVVDVGAALVVLFRDPNLEHDPEKWEPVFG